MQETLAKQAAYGEQAGPEESDGARFGSDGGAVCNGDAVEEGERRLAVGRALSEEGQRFRGAGGGEVEAGLLPTVKPWLASLRIAMERV